MLATKIRKTSSGPIGSTLLIEAFYYSKINHGAKRPVCLRAVRSLVSIFKYLALWGSVKRRRSVIKGFYSLELFKVTGTSTNRKEISNLISSNCGSSQLGKVFLSAKRESQRDLDPLITKDLPVLGKTTLNIFELFTKCYPDLSIDLNRQTLTHEMGRSFCPISLFSNNHRTHMKPHCKNFQRACLSLLILSIAVVTPMSLAQTNPGRTFSTNTTSQTFTPATRDPINSNFFATRAGQPCTLHDGDVNAEDISLLLGEVKFGDFNLDGTINLWDLVYLRMASEDPVGYTERFKISAHVVGDINGDAFYDAKDTALLGEIINCEH